MFLTTNRYLLYFMSRDYNIILTLFDLFFSNLITYESTINSKEVIKYPHRDVYETVNWKQGTCE